MNERLDILLRQREAAISGLRTLVDEATTRGALTAEDKAEVAKREAEIADLDTLIKSARNLDTLEASLRETQAVTPEGRNAENGESEYREVFMQFVRTGIVDSESAKILRTGYVKEEARDMNVGVAAQGGYVVPPTFEKSLIARAIEFSVMRQVIGDRMETGTGSTITLPKEGSIGAAAWLDESAAFVESDDSFGEATLEAWKAGRLVKSTIELLEDAFFDVEAYLSNSLGMAIGILESAAFVNGDGTKKPKGFLLDAQTGVTAASATAITGDEVIDLIYSVRPFYRANGKFVVSDDAVRVLRKLKDGNGRYLWQDNALNGLTQGAAPATLLGYPVYTEVNMPVVAINSTSVAFGDFSRYAVRDVAGVRLARLNERFLADEGKIGFLGWHRTDGELLDPTAIKVIKQAAA
jgi:HK97 family phage major capsid protein